MKRSGHNKRLDRSSRRRHLLVESLEPRLVLAAPVALDDILAVTQNQATDIQSIIANDQDSDGDALSITSTTTPANGTLAMVDGVLQYTPNPGFAGSDAFNYTVADAASNSDTATVRLSVNATVDVTAARNQILNEVSGALPNPTQPGKMVTYGPTAFSLVHESGEDESRSLLAAATLGQGRIIALNDHQWLEMSNHGSDANMAKVYLNGIDWLGDQVSGTTVSKNIKVVTLNNTANANWLTSQGYTNVVNATWSTLAGQLVDADVLVAGWMGNNVSDSNRATVAQFARTGGGVYVADYASGYVWWWNKPNDQVPGNLLLRDAGIWMVPEIIWDNGPVANDATTTNLTGPVLVSIINKSLAVSSATETIALEKFARLLDYLPADDPLRHELNAAFLQHRFGDVQATPVTPQSSSLAKSLLTAEASWLKRQTVDEIPAHPTAAAVYGAISPAATIIDGQSFTVQVDKSGWITTGVYALPGEVVTLTVPTTLVGKGYKFRINGHVDNISSRSSWDRLPSGVSTSFDIDSTTVRIANSFGGTIYLEVGGGAATETPPNLGPVTIVVNGAIEAPTFRLGEMTNAEWQTERLKPGAYAELISERLAMSIPSSWIRNLANPMELMKFWDEVVERMDWVGGVESIRTGPDRFNVDVQISVGLLHAGYPIQGPTWASEELVVLSDLQRSGNWGYFHELGHEKQRNNVLGHGYDSAWTFSGDVEVTVNIFANAGLELQVPDSPTNGWGYSVYPELVMQRASTTTTDANNPNFDDKDPYPFYFQLADGVWGWQGYRDVLSTYVDDYLNTPNELPGDNTAEKDQWLIRWSQISGYNMTEYMVDHWNLEVTPGAITQVQSMNLPSWMPLAVKKDVIRSRIPVGSAQTLDLANAGVGLDGVATFVNTGANTNGALTINPNGTYTWTPNLDFIGVGTYEVTYQSSAGNRQTFVGEVEVSNRGVLTETFLGIAGSAISDLTSNSNYPDQPDSTEINPEFETPTNQAESYGVRTRAFLQVPATGEYTFWIASDDNGRLLFSSDTNPDNATVIAQVDGWTSSRQWDKFTSQKSTTINLVQGETYYIEALMKEGNGGDNLAVAWTSPALGLTEPFVIANEYLLVYAETAPNIDFNSDGILDVADLNSLVTLASLNLTAPNLDVNSDGAIDKFDIHLWLRMAAEVNIGAGAKYRFGDANLDGIVDVSDYHQILKHQFNGTATWEQGDFDADGQVGTSDFQLWNTHRFLQAAAPVALASSANAVTRTPHAAAKAAPAVVGDLELPEMEVAVQNRGYAFAALGPHSVEPANPPTNRLWDAVFAVNDEEEEKER